MSHTPHELAEDFPNDKATISALKQSDAHFAKLAEAYHDINAAIHLAETNVAPVDGLAEVEMRKKRGHLKDEIAAYLAAAAE